MSENKKRVLHVDIHFDVVTDTPKETAPDLMKTMKISQRTGWAIWRYFVKLGVIQHLKIEGHETVPGDWIHSE